jgi:hypothetical protein
MFLGGGYGYFLKEIQVGEHMRFIAEDTGNTSPIFSDGKNAVYEFIATHKESYLSFFKRHHLNPAFRSVIRVSEWCPLFPHSGMRIRGDIVFYERKNIDVTMMRHTAGQDFIQITDFAPCDDARRCDFSFELLLSDRCIPWAERFALEKFLAMKVGGYFIKNLSFVPINTM